MYSNIIAFVFLTACCFFLWMNFWVEIKFTWFPLHFITFSNSISVKCSLFFVVTLLTFVILFSSCHRILVYMFLNLNAHHFLIFLYNIICYLLIFSNRYLYCVYFCKSRGSFVFPILLVLWKIYFCPIISCLKLEISFREKVYFFRVFGC